MPAWKCLLAAFAGLAPSWAAAYGISDVLTNPVVPFNGQAVFPNWIQAPLSSFTIYECDSVTCPGCASPGAITGITIMNFGSATGGPGGDLTNLYFDIVCGSKTTSGVTPMTFAGNWTVATGTFPAWTWAGSVPFGGDPCSGPGFDCSCNVNLFVYGDISPCPTAGDTIDLGPGFNDVLNPLWPGGVTDACGYAGPWADTQDPVQKSIQYIYKTVDQTQAAPGDTLNYTVYYGLPGVGTLTSLWITDTMPSYTHLVTTGLPAPDPGWNPLVGPPNVLRWTVGPLSSAGGPTGAVTFGLTIDWGNTEVFEPGSGDVAAPEGAFVFNSADLAWSPLNGCASGRTSNTVNTVVKRYLFWKIGDNDVLLASSPGQPNDEITYSIFLKNLSAQKTWWNVDVWDTVPAGLDPWTTGEGFNDPCVGWTMTPTGCSAASPGVVVSGGKTILTWHLDIPPALTLNLQWKAQLRSTVAPGASVFNQAAIYAYGHSSIIGGTGSAQALRTFTHFAMVVLRTTYVSYVGWAGTAANYWACTTQTYFLDFYPLNKAADCALYTHWCCGAAPCDTACAPFAANGGVSPQINVFAGTCTGGPAPNWVPGCLSQRAPAQFIPSAFATGAAPSFPFNFLHKLVANSPFIWELSMCLSKNNQDANTAVGTTSLTYAGYMGYTFLRECSCGANIDDSLAIVNTDPTQATTVFVFEWDPVGQQWNFAATQDLYNESQWVFDPSAAGEPQGHFRIISSNTPLIIQKCYYAMTIGGGDNDKGTLFPNKQNGNLVSSTTPADFYLYAGYIPGVIDAAIVGNVGLAAATYQVWMYTPLNTTLPLVNPVNVDPFMVGNAGFWTLLGTDNVPAGTAFPTAPPANNAHVYGPAYDNSTFTHNDRLFKIHLVSGGPIQVSGGRAILDAYSGGAVMHPAIPAGASMGTEYWLHTDAQKYSCNGPSGIQTVDIFSPKYNLAVTAASNDGYTATYTTNAVDECISFMSTTSPASGVERNFRFDVLPGGNTGNVIAQYIMCEIGEKFYSSPFLQLGVHYEILAPPVVFSGQSFWMTVVVLDSGGGTKTDYCGTSAFTSSDPKATMGGTGMSAYDFTWNSSTACSGATNENGVTLFVNVTFTTLGLQTLIASDTVDGSITGLTAIMVVGADVKLTKSPPFMVAASGDTVQFRICWSNYSSASAFTFVITDAVPQGTSYVPEVVSAMACGDTDGVTSSVGYSTVLTGTMPASFTTLAPGSAPPAATTWLRWTYFMAGVQTTGCACFRVAVD